MLQGIVGELLWLSRTTRHDVTYAVAQIAARLTKWTDKCDKQLAVLMGYISAHPDLDLTYAAGPGDS